MFADDIRFEAGNKHSLMGIYPDVILIHDGFPATLNRFVVSANYMERPGESSASVDVIVQGPGEDGEVELARFTIPADWRNMLVPEDAAPLDTFFRATANLVFNNLTLPKPGRLKVWAEVDDMKVRLGQIPVKAATT